MKIFVYILMLVMLLSACHNPFGTEQIEIQEQGYETNSTVEFKETDENGEITNEFALLLLDKKTSGNKLSDTELKYINFFHYSENGGVAILDNHGIGMHKTVAQVYVYSKTNKEWQHFEKMFFTTGSTEYLLKEEGLVILINSNVTEGTTEEYLIPAEDIFK